MTYYLHHLRPPLFPPLLRNPDYTQSDPSIHDLSPIPSQAVVEFCDHLEPQPRCSTIMADAFTSMEDANQNPSSKPCILLAGYSYGAIIACCLPPLIGSMIADFQTPAPDSPHAEIRLRASSLASQQNSLMAARVHSLLSQAHLRGRALQIEDHNLASPKTRKSNGGVRMGGEENLRRASHESHRSRSSFTLESPVLVRKSVDRIRSIGHGRFSPRRTQSAASFSLKKASESESSIEQVVPEEKGSIKAIPGIVSNLQVAYLLVSPPYGWATTLATMWTMKTSNAKTPIPECDMKYTLDPTLVIFGNDDPFVRIKTLRNWVEKLASARKGKGESRFKHIEVHRAGHFWHDQQASLTLKNEVRDFVSTL